MIGEQRVGDFRVICDFSGFKSWRSECVKTWDGFLVRREFVGSEQSRHPQEFVRGVPENSRLPDPRPEQTDVFVAPGDVTASDL